MPYGTSDSVPSSSDLTLPILPLVTCLKGIKGSAAVICSILVGILFGPVALLVSTSLMSFIALTFLGPLSGMVLPSF